MMSLFAMLVIYHHRLSFRKLDGNDINKHVYNTSNVSLIFEKYLLEAITSN